MDGVVALGDVIGAGTNAGFLPRNYFLQSPCAAQISLRALEDFDSEGACRIMTQELQGVRRAAAGLAAMAA